MALSSVSNIADEEKMFALVGWQLTSVKEESWTREIREENSKRLAGEESSGERTRFGPERDVCVFGR